MESGSLRRRRLLRLAGSVSVVATAGCFGGGDGGGGALGGSGGGPSGDPDINETISETKSYSVELQPGDTVWLEITDGDETRFVEYQIVPPEGNPLSIRKTSIEDSWTAEVDGEHELVVDPSLETEVKIWVG